jgi:hypothetical protein
MAISPASSFHQHPQKRLGFAQGMVLGIGLALEAGELFNAAHLHAYLAAVDRRFSEGLRGTNGQQIHLEPRHLHPMPAAAADSESGAHLHGHRL